NSLCCSALVGYARVWREYRTLTPICHSARYRLAKIPVSLGIKARFAPRSLGWGICLSVVMTILAILVVATPSRAQTWDETNAKAGQALAAGDHAEATRLYRFLVEEAEKTSNQRLISALGGLAVANQQSKAYEEAERNYRRALTLAEATYGPDDPVT